MDVIFKESDRKLHNSINIEIIDYYKVFFHLFGSCFHCNGY